MPGQYNLDQGGSMGADAYRKLLAERMARYGGDRDAAVRSANIAAGFGNSTAERFMHGGGAAPKKGGGGGGGAKAGGGGGGGSTADVPIPQPRPDNFSPDLAVSPPHERWPGATAGPTFSPDLAVSPPRGDMMWPGATGGGGGYVDRLPQNAVGGGVPMSPALSMASILRAVPPELLGGGGGRDFGFTNTALGQGARAGQAAAAAARRAHRPGFANIFKVEPPDPNESWWQAMLRG
jgi:hypothetical protein